MAQIIFRAGLDALEAVLSWVRHQLDLALFSEIASREVQLALEEAVVNVIHHAYSGKEGQVELTCLFSEQNRQIEFCLKDRGPFFNPLTQIIETPLKLENKKEGGLGILLMRHYMDKVSYERIGGYNVLTLTKKR